MITIWRTLLRTLFRDSDEANVSMAAPRSRKRLRIVANPTDTITGLLIRCIEDVKAYGVLDELIVESSVDHGDRTGPADVSARVFFDIRDEHDSDGDDDDDDDGGDDDDVTNEAGMMHVRAVLRYIGRLCHIYPSRVSLHTALVDDWLELHADLCAALAAPEPSPPQLPRQAKVDAAVERVLEHRAPWLSGFEEPTLADFVWVRTLKWLQAGSVPNVGVSSDPRLDAYLSDYDALCGDGA